jgi:hypothetical protein
VIGAPWLGEANGLHRGDSGDQVPGPCPGQSQGPGRSAARIATLAPGLSIALYCFLLDDAAKARATESNILLLRWRRERCLAPASPSCLRASCSACRRASHGGDVSTTRSYRQSIQRTLLPQTFRDLPACSSPARQLHPLANVLVPAACVVAPRYAPLGQPGAHRRASLHLPQRYVRYYQTVSNDSHVCTHVDRDLHVAVLDVSTVQRAYRAMQMPNVKPCLSRTRSRIVRSSHWKNAPGRLQPCSRMHRQGLPHAPALGQRSEESLPNSPLKPCTGLTAQVFLIRRFTLGPILYAHLPSLALRAFRVELLCLAARHEADCALQASLFLPGRPTLVSSSAARRCGAPRQFRAYGVAYGASRMWRCARYRCLRRNVRSIHVRSKCVCYVQIVSQVVAT